MDSSPYGFQYRAPTSFRRTPSIFTRSFFSRHPRSQRGPSLPPPPPFSAFLTAARRLRGSAGAIDGRSSSLGPRFDLPDIPFESREKVLSKISTVSTTETIAICRRARSDIKRRKCIQFFFGARVYFVNASLCQ